MTFVDLMMSCASSDRLGVTNFWPRAQSALVTGASTERRWSGIISRTAAKLEIEDGGIYEREAAELAMLGERLADPDTLARWCELVTSDAVYIVAMCRIRRTARKAAAPTKKPTKRQATPAQATLDAEEAPF